MGENSPERDIRFRRFVSGSVSREETLDERLIKDLTLSGVSTA